jgi:hypothetical protein
MGNRDKRGREKKKPKKQGNPKSRPTSPLAAIRPAAPSAQQPTNTGDTGNVEPPRRTI